ncbi:hypothetical protein [Persicobacter diffluens]|uniref:Lipoprotein n=1 Tax=Persicobacter diffluens TaxID=981 RepID=A0AAN5AM99_9BACT|nr:hypothetical protein PEDI_47460 [Persicobacter diffluens]
MEIRLNNPEEIRKSYRKLIYIFLFSLISCEYKNTHIVKLNGKIIITCVNQDKSSFCVNSVKYYNEFNDEFYLNGNIWDNSTYASPSMEITNRGSLENSIHCQDKLRNRAYFTGGDTYKIDDTNIFFIAFRIKGDGFWVDVSKNKDYVQEINKVDIEDLSYENQCPENIISESYIVLLKGFETETLSKSDVDSLQFKRVYFDRLIRLE